MKKAEGPNVEFIALNKAFKTIFDPPVPASTVLPDWYKRMEMFIDGKFEISDISGNANRTIKACMPVFDMLTAGYIFTIPAEVYIQKTNEGIPKTSWSIDNYTLIDSHIPQQFNEFKLGDEFYPYGLKFHNTWIMKTPPGYSTLFIQPAMRDDLPFQIVPAIVDTDKHPSPVNFPFFMRKDFEGVFELGMPIVQAIPFKREDWTHSISHHADNEGEAEWQHAKRKIINRYKHFFRTPKSWK
jgi:hypothetical protein